MFQADMATSSTRLHVNREMFRISAIYLKDVLSIQGVKRQWIFAEKSFPKEIVLDGEHRIACWLYTNEDKEEVL